MPSRAQVKNQPVEFLEFVEDDLGYAYNYYDSWLADGSTWFRDHFRETRRVDRVEPRDVSQEISFLSSGDHPSKLLRDIFRD